MGVCNCSMFCCMLLYVHSSIAIILMGKRELIALLNCSFWCLVMVELLFLAVPRGCLQLVIVVFPDHTRLLFLKIINLMKWQSVQMMSLFQESRTSSISSSGQSVSVVSLAVTTVTNLVICLGVEQMNGEECKEAVCKNLSKM